MIVAAYILAITACVVSVITTFFLRSLAAGVLEHRKAVRETEIQLCELVKGLEVKIDDVDSRVRLIDRDRKEKETKLRGDLFDEADAISRRQKQTDARLDKSQDTRRRVNDLEAKVGVLDVGVSEHQEQTDTRLSNLNEHVETIRNALCEFSHTVGGCLTIKVPADDLFGEMETKEADA